MSGEDYRVYCSIEQKEVNISKAIKNDRIARNTKNIGNFLDKRNISYTVNKGILTIIYKDKTYVVGLKSGKIRVKGKNKWYLFSKKFFN